MGNILYLLSNIHIVHCRKWAIGQPVEAETSISVPVIAPARLLKHRASVRDLVPLKARQDNGVQRFPSPGHGGELELLPGCSCDHTCAPPLLELPGTRIPPGELPRLVFVPSVWVCWLQFRGFSR